MRHSPDDVLPAGRGFQGGSSLSVHRAFVVHFGTGGGSRRRFHGRVEHLSSGRTAVFSSLRTLLGFVAVVLDGSQPVAPRSPTDRTRTTDKTRRRAVLAEAHRPHRGRRQASVTSTDQGEDLQ